MATLPIRDNPVPVTSLKNILFATDFSEASMHAFPYVCSVARKFGAAVFACHIITSSSLVAAASQAAPYLYEAEYNTATEELGHMVGSKELQGVKTQAIVSSGMLGDVLADEINQNKID